MNGVCKGLDGQKVQGTDEILVANPDCICWNPLAAMTCPYGHMLECHYQLTCEEANCDHYQRERELENDHLTLDDLELP